VPTGSRFPPSVVAPWEFDPFPPRPSSRIKHVLGIWVQSAEGASFWAQVCAELANRGVRDIIIACCDGLTGLPEAIEATFPFTVVQTCVVHYADIVVMPMRVVSLLVAGVDGLSRSA
jgi:hypothetical protein